MMGERPNERPWVDQALTWLMAGDAVALISVLEVAGSTPREAGTRMVVTKTDAFGTIGGGNLEFQAIAQAHHCLEHPTGTWRIQDYPLGPLMNQCCGGRVRVMIERLDRADQDWLCALQTGDEVSLITELTEGKPVRQIYAPAMPPPARQAGHLPRKQGRTECDDIYPPLLAGEVAGLVPPEGGRRRPFDDRLIEHFERARDPLAIFGAGHVGQALMHVLEGLPYRIGWYDNREDYRGLAGLELLDEDGLIAKAQTATDQVLIMTHDHALDYRLTVAALQSEARFIGLIGSMTKRARFLSRLVKDGFDAAAIARVNCPIGVVGIVGKAPQIIAVSVAAQLLLNREAHVQAKLPLVGCAC